MATYGNPGPSSDYFSDGPAESGGPPKEKSEGQTAILPKSILAGKEFKPGEEVVLKIVAIHDNDVEVEYSHDEEKEEESPAEPPMEGAPPAPGGDMASMME